MLTVLPPVCHPRLGHNCLCSSRRRGRRSECAKASVSSASCTYPKLRYRLCAGALSATTWTYKCWTPAVGHTGSNHHWVPAVSFPAGSHRLSHTRDQSQTHRFSHTRVHGAPYTNVPVTETELTRQTGSDHCVPLAAGTASARPQRVQYARHTA